MYRLKEKTAKAILPVDTAQWGELMCGESIQRLQKVQSLIEGFRLVYSNADGDGLGLIILEGSKVFIPVIARDWQIEPIDVVIYKKGSETKYGYLSERTLLRLLITSSLGVAVGGRQGGLSDSAVNLFSPAGGYGARVANPWSPLAAPNLSRAKASSLIEPLTQGLPEPLPKFNLLTKMAYAAELFKEDDFWKTSPALTEFMSNLDKKPVDQYGVLEKDGDSYKLYAPSSPEGLDVNEEQVSKLFSTLDDDSRRSKTAALFSDDNYTIFGDQANRETVYLRPTLRNEQTPHLKKDPVKPAREGIYYLYSDQYYINPHVLNVDGSRSDYTLMVKSNQHFLKEDVAGFENLHTVESSILSRDDLMQSNTANKPGDLIAIYDRFNNTISEPLELLLPSRGKMGDLILRVRPVYGNPAPILIEFYNGARIVDKGSSVLYPSATSIIYTLPPAAESDPTFCRPMMTNPNQVMVDITKGGAECYDILEEGSACKRVHSRAELVFYLMTRYGLGKGTAENLKERLFKEPVLRFAATRYIAPAKKNNMFTASNPREKEAIKALISLASRFSKYAKLDIVDFTGLSYLNNLVKTASVEDQSVGNTAKGYQAPPGPAQAGLPPAQQTKGQLFLSLLQNTPAASRNTQEVIDLLSFYALGQYRSEEGIRLLGEIESSLSEVEDNLAKVLILSQMGRIPGMDYSETKLLLSDVDSYLARILSSKVLLKNQ